MLGTVGPWHGGEEGGTWHGTVLACTVRIDFSDRAPGLDRSAYAKVLHEIWKYYSLNGPESPPDALDKWRPDAHTRALYEAACAEDPLPLGLVGDGRALIGFGLDNGCEIRGLRCGWLW